MPRVPADVRSTCINIKWGRMKGVCCWFTASSAVVTARSGLSYRRLTDPVLPALAATTPRPSIVSLPCILGSIGLLPMTRALRSWGIAFRLETPDSSARAASPMKTMGDTTDLGEGRQVPRHVSGARNSSCISWPVGKAREWLEALHDETATCDGAFWTARNGTDSFLPDELNPNSVLCCPTSTPTGGCE